MQIVLNGESHPITLPQTVAQLVDQLGLTGKAIAIAINRRVIPAKKWQETTLQPDDQVEVVRAIGGG